MKEERSSVLEFKWWASALIALLASLVPFLVLGGFVAALRGTGGPDRINFTIGLGLYGPVTIFVWLSPFFTGAALGVRLLVPTFAGVPPRLVAAVCTTWPVALGGYLQTTSAALTLVLAAIAVVWALVMPMPRKNVLSYGPIAGGALVGLALGAIAYQYEGLLLAIVWCAWRLYKNHAPEVVATAACTVILPGLLIVTEGVSSASASAYQIVEIALLVGLALAGLVISQVRREPQPQA